MNEYGFWLDSREALDDTAIKALPAFTERPCWLHLNRTDNGLERAFIQHLPTHLAVAALAEETRPRWQWEHDGTLLLIMRGINFNPGKEAEDMVSLRCIVTGTSLITLAGQRLKSVDEAVARLTRASEAVDQWQMLGDILRNLVRGADEHLKTLTGGLLDMEMAWLEHKKDLRSALMVMERRLLSLRRHIEPQQEMLDDLSDELDEVLPANARTQLLEILDRMTRLLESLNLLRERIKLLRDDMNAERDAQMNKTLYLLSIVTALFLPLSVITGFFGMNVGGLPWLEDKHGTLWVSLLMAGSVACSGLLMWWRRWF